MTCEHCNKEYPASEDKAGYMGLCKYCRADLIAIEELQGHAKKYKMDKEFNQIKKQYAKLARRIERIENVINHSLP